MPNHSTTYRFVALTLVLLTTLATTPVTAAELAAPADGVLGAVRTGGTVQLRGVNLIGEGTVFAGDTLQSRADGAATVRFTLGQQIEMGSNTRVTVNADESVVQLAMASGNMAFASDVGSPLSIAIAPLEFYLDADASGNVAIVGDQTVGVRVTQGSVLVRNTESKKSFVLIQGQEKLIGRYNGIVADPIAVIASSLPTSIPTSLPAAPQQGSGLSNGAWASIIALVAGGAAVGAVFAGRSGTVDEGALTVANNTISTQSTQLTSLNSQISDLNATIATLNSQIASPSQP
jgi:hypothetical protein